MTPTQSARDISVSSVLKGDVLLFRSMRGSEGLSCLSEYRLELLSTRNDIKIEEMLGSMMSVAIKLMPPAATGKLRHFSGVVTGFALAGRTGRYAVYHATLRPWLWFLTRAADCRIFQDKSLLEILKAVFSAYSIADVDTGKLVGNYSAKLPYCVQYRETDFNFVSRLMEQEGIYYYFKSQAGRHTMVLADSYGAHQPMESYDSLPYMPVQPEAIQVSEAITEWRMEGEIQSGSVSLKAYDFENPSTSSSGALLVKSSLVRKHDQADLAVFDYPGKFIVHGAGEQQAQARIEALQGRYQQAQAVATVRGIHPGSLLSMSGHPRSDQNQKYLLVSAEYELHSDYYESVKPEPPLPPFLCRFSAIPKGNAWRAEARAAKPVVQGPQTAMVVGKAGEEIWTDKYGRIKVQFHWDRLGKDDEKSSCWVRVAQGWAGKRWGALFTPRIGQEVIVSFLEGDPDQPLVTGSVYNAVTMPPYALPENATRSTIKSNSSKGGGGYNELRFEDKKGSEQIFMHAEKNQDTRVKNDALWWIGNDEHHIVKKNQHEQIGGVQHTKVVGNRNEKVGGVASLDVAKDLQQKAGMVISMEAGKDIHIKAGMNVVIEAGASISLKAGGAFVVIGPSSVAVSGSPILLNSGGSAGSAAGASPKEPADPKEADDGKK